VFAGRRKLLLAPSPPSQFLSATNLHPDTLRRGYLHAEDLHQLADHHYSRQLFGHHYLHGGFHLERALERCDLAGGRGHCRHSSSRPEYRGSSHLGGDRRAPFSYMRTGFGPATYRRGIPLSRLGKRLNPFPLVHLPYHRLVNPWTLGAVLHEISHNLQSDLGLGRDVPRSIALCLLRAGMLRSVASTWTRWNREMFADMSALLLGGPGVVGVLMDVIGRGAVTVVTFNPRGVHPTPYLRMFNSIELLRRMGFTKEAEQYRRAWTRIYPSAAAGDIPQDMLRTFPKACALAVDAMCYRPYPSLGNKSLAQVIQFGRKEQQMIEEAARRLAAGVNPGIIPERFVIGAARLALDRRLARPGVITANFYKTLASG